MDIRLSEIGNAGCQFAWEMLSSEPISEERARKNTVAFSNNNRDYVANIVIGAIAEYHDALRDILLNQGIDIGGFKNELVFGDE